MNIVPYDCTLLYMPVGHMWWLFVTTRKWYLTSYALLMTGLYHLFLVI